MTAMEQQIGMMIGACFTFFSPVMRCLLRPGSESEACV